MHMVVYAERIRANRVSYSSYISPSAPPSTEALPSKSHPLAIIMTRLYSLAAAGALLLSATFVTAESFDVRNMVLEHKFGDLVAHQLVRRQEFNSTETQTPDDLLSSELTSVTATATGASASDSSGDLDSTTVAPSRTRSALFGAATTSASDSDYYGYFSGPDLAYIANMCMPNLVDTSRANSLGIKLKVTNQKDAYLEMAKLVISLGGSPFPCEQGLYIEYACHANATKPVDYLAEQQCYCGSTFWEADQACNDCFLAHGLKGPSKKEYGDRMNSFSSKVCDSTPMPRGIGMAAQTELPDQTAILRYESASAVAHPSKSAVSYYATIKPMSVPAITGEAAARQTTWGNMDGKGGYSGAGVNAAPMLGAILGAMALGAGLIL